MSYEIADSDTEDIIQMKKSIISLYSQGMLRKARLLENLLAAKIESIINSAIEEYNGVKA